MGAQKPKQVRINISDESARVLAELTKDGAFSETVITSAVLEAARVADPDVCRQLAIRYFAGLRTQEAMLLREDDVRLEDGIIVVPASKAKTRRRRVVEISGNLRAWLALGGVLRGMRPSTIRAIVRSSGVPWPPNVSRHSWCSYHLEAGQNAARTALQAGHAEAVLFSHYRALVTPAAAREYWAILPPPGTPPAPFPRPA